MATIIELVRDRKAVILGDHAKANRTGELARAAINGGHKSPDWEEYMQHFGALSSDQLARLKATDGTEGDPGLDFRRAYLVANGACGMASPDTQNLDFLVETIDDPAPVPVPKTPLALPAVRG